MFSDSDKWSKTNQTLSPPSSNNDTVTIADMIFSDAAAAANNLIFANTHLYSNIVRVARLACEYYKTHGLKNWNEDDLVAGLPLDFYRTVRPPSVYKKCHFPPIQLGNECFDVYDGSKSLDSKRGSPPAYQTAPISPFTPEVYSLPGIVSGVDSESIISDLRYSCQTSNEPSKIAVNFKKMVQAALLEDQSSTDLNHLDNTKEEWEELVDIIEKKRIRECSSDSSCEEPTATTTTTSSSRDTFMKSFHPFGSSYPLKNWL